MVARTIVVPSTKKNPITVSRATTVMGIRRTILEAELKLQFAEETDIARRIGAVTIYPSLAACSSAKKLPTVEEFLDMDGELSDAWCDAAMTLNPRWFEFRVETPKEIEKKES